MSIFLITFGLTLVIGGPALLAAWLIWPEQTGRVLDWGVDAAHLAAPHKGQHIPPLDERLAAAWRTLAAAVRGCLSWPAGQMPRPEMLRAPAAASAPGDGPAPVPLAGAGPLTDAPGGASPYPALTAPQPRLDEPLPLASRYVPAAPWEPYEPSGMDVIA